jgi:hypothetical protein
VKARQIVVETVRQAHEAILTFEEMRAEIESIAEDVELMTSDPEREQLEKRLAYLRERVRKAIEVRRRPN